MANGLVMVAMAGLIGLGAPPQPAQAETPLKATFRCANNASCPSVGAPDAIQSDGAVEHGATFDGFRTWTVKKTANLDGAFVNTAGGIDINLISEGTIGDRALTFRLGGPVLSIPGAPQACQPGSGVITATDVDFRFNVTTGSTQGIALLANGDSATGSPNSSGQRVIGIVNFAIAPNVSGALFFNHTQDSIAPFDDQITLARSAVGTSYLLTSASTVLLQCTITNRGRTTTYNVGTYSVPFELTVVQ